MSEAPSWQGAKVFVTGATGLLGAHLTRELVQQGAEVVALVRNTRSRSLFHDEDPDWQLEKKVITVHGAVEDYELLQRTLVDYEIESVFHLAAQTIVGVANRNPVDTFKSNIEGTWNLLEAARRYPERIQRILIASSDKAYGTLEGDAYTESSPLRGEHPYDVSKSCADMIARAYAVTYEMPIAVTRCGNFFGPGDFNFSRIIPGTIRDVLEGRAPVIRSDGTFIRDYLFAEDGAHAYLTLAAQMIAPAGGAPIRHSGEAFNFSYGLRLSAKDVVQRILELLSCADVTPVILDEAGNEIPVQCLDSSKAARVLGWTPRYGFDEGLKLTVDWYRKELGCDRPHAPASGVS